MKALSANQWTTRALPRNTIFFFLKFYLFISWLCWVFIALHGLSLVAMSESSSSLWPMGFSLQWLLLLWSTGFRCTGFSSCGTWASCMLWSAGSVVVAHGLHCSVAYGIFLDQGLNTCLLHWQTESRPLHHQGSPNTSFNGCIK